MGQDVIEGIILDFEINSLLDPFWFSSDKWWILPAGHRWYKTFIFGSVSRSGLWKSIFLKNIAQYFGIISVSFLWSQFSLIVSLLQRRVKKPQNGVQDSRTFRANSRLLLFTVVFYRIDLLFLSKSIWKKCYYRFGIFMSSLFTMVTTSRPRTLWYCITLKNLPDKKKFECCINI